MSIKQLNRCFFVPKRVTNVKVVLFIHFQLLVHVYEWLNFFQTPKSPVSLFFIQLTFQKLFLDTFLLVVILLLPQLLWDLH